MKPKPKFLLIYNICLLILVPTITTENNFTDHEAFGLPSHEEIVVTLILASLVLGGGVMCTIWSSYKTTKGKVKTDVHNISQ